MSIIFNQKKIRGILLTGVLVLGGLWSAMPVKAAVDIEALKERIELERSGLPENMEEKPLVMKSVTSDTVNVYTDADLVEVCDIIEGKDLEISITDATKNAVFGEYTCSAGTGTGWITNEVFFENPSYEKQYNTIRRDGIPVYKNKNYDGEPYQTEQYTGLILINKKGDKRQVIYEKEQEYATGWVKSEDFENTLEYDGRPQQLIVDGTYIFHNVSKNDGSKTYSEDSYAKTLTLIHAKNDEYYVIDEKGRWLSDQDGKCVWNKTETPEADGLFNIERAEKGYTLKNSLNGDYLSMKESGKLTLEAAENGNQTTWRISATQKMLSLKKPLVITQYDPKWCGKPYGTDDITGCIGAAGCGILAPVNAVYALTGQQMDVFDLVDFSVKNHYRIIGSGTMDTVFKAIAKKNGENYGFAWDGSSEKIDVLVKKLKKGDVAVSHVDGHYLTVAACSDDGKKFLLLDSNRLPKRETSAFGDWVDVKRLEEGTLSSTGYFFYKHFDGKHVVEKKKKSKKKTSTEATQQTTAQ